MCTDTDHGFSSSNEYSNTITWKSVRNGVKKVELVFKQTGDHLGHAQIAEMEIIYNNERNDKGKNCQFRKIILLKFAKLYFQRLQGSVLSIKHHEKWMVIKRICQEGQGLIISIN